MDNISSNQIAKRDLVQKLNESFAENSIAVVFHYHGLTVSNISDLRKRMRDSGANMYVVKNTLAKLAAVNTDFACLDKVLVGPTAIVYSSDPGFVKSLCDFIKSNDKAKVVGGALNGQLIDQKGVEVLATLPSLEELRAKILGVLQAPARCIATVVNAVPSSVVRVIKANADKGGEA